MAEVNKAKLRLIIRLANIGITSEKAVLSLKLKDILSIPNITKQELSAICDLQDAIKEGNILTFLTTQDVKSNKLSWNEKEIVNEAYADNET